MTLPPSIRAVSSRSDAVSRLAEARDLVLSGHITLLRNWSPDGDDLSPLASFGPVFEPIALPPDKELGPVTRLAETGVLRSATSWHHDQSFASQPPTWSALFCHKTGSMSVPTFFCDGAALVSHLSPGLSTVLDDLRAWHSAEYGPLGSDTQAVASAVHPVLLQVEGGVTALFISPATVESFDGWTLQESAALLDYLFSMMNWPELTIGHLWRPRDLLIWPNRRYLHRALPLDVGQSARRLSRIVGHW
jgi:alpha-ketoglutarate-dependent taurine dioxygenase